jgi:hypothetical protein
MRELTEQELGDLDDCFGAGGAEYGQQIAYAIDQAVARAIRDAKPLIDACYEDMHGDICSDYLDNEYVASTLSDEGAVAPHGSITFGMIRRAVAVMRSQNGG